MKNITIIGGGVLGSQIAFQAAYSGFQVTIWLRSEESIARSKIKIKELKKTYIKDINTMAKNKSKDTWCLGVKNITNALEEKEREEFTRLKVIKERIS